MQYIVHSRNWTSQPADFITQATDGDIIVVVSDATKELGERARLRMCPDKRITFQVVANNS